MMTIIDSAVKLTLKRIYFNVCTVQLVQFIIQIKKYTTQFVGVIYFILIHCRITPIRLSRLYMRPPNKQFPLVIIINVLQTVFYH